MLESKFEAILDQIDDELQGAEEYIKCAAANKEFMPEMSDMYLRMASTEMEHAVNLHDMMGKMLSKHEEHTHLHSVWNWQKERLARWMTKIRAKMEAAKK